MTLRAAVQFRIIRVAEPATPEPFAGQTVSHVYSFATRARAEILMFQWTPEAVGAGAITFPHLHIGPAISGAQSVIRPDTFHKITSQPALFRWPPSSVWRSLSSG